MFFNVVHITKRICLLMHTIKNSLNNIQVLIRYSVKLAKKQNKVVTKEVCVYLIQIKADGSQFLMDSLFLKNKSNTVVRRGSSASFLSAGLFGIDYYFRGADYSTFWSV